MNDKQLQTFIDVSRNKSFTQVAEQNGLSTTAIVNQVNNLEKKIGFKLFERTTHGVRLTDQGEVFLKASQQIMSIYKDAVNRCKGINTRAIKVVDYLGTQFYQMDDFGIDYQMAHPGTDIKIYRSEGVDFEKNLQMLRESNVDMIFCQKPRDEYLDNLKFVSMYDDQYAFIVNALSGFGISEKGLENKYVTLRVMEESEAKDSIIKYLRQRKALINEEDIYKAGDQYYREVVDGNVLILPYSLCRKGIKRLKIIKTDFPAGEFGFVFRKDASEEVLIFLKEYINSQNTVGLDSVLAMN